MTINRAQILITAVDQTREALQSARSGLLGLSDVAGGLNKVLGALGLAISAAGLVQLVRKSINAADEMAKLAQKTGASVEFLSTLKPVAEMAGTSLDTVSRAMGRLSQGMAEADSGSERHQALFARLNVAYADASGELRQVDQVLLDVASAFQAMPDGPEKAALAIELFGRSGAELIPFLNQGRDGIEALQRKMADLGLEMNSNTAKAAEAFNDALATVGYAIQGIVNQALIAMTPLLLSTADAMEWLATNLDTIMGLFKLLAEVTLAVLIYRSIPAAIAAFKSLGAAALAAAQSASAAWALANTDALTATKSIGLLHTAFLLLGALLVGWEIGKWLSERFEVVRKAGIFMVEVLVTGFEYLRYAWEVFAAVFTSDTIAQATERHQERLAAMKGIFAEMYRDAETGSQAVAGAVDTAATAADRLAQQMAQARQETAQSLQAGIDALEATLGHLEKEIQRIDGLIDASRKRVDDALKAMGQSYQGLTAEVQRESQLQQDAQDALYAERLAAVERWTTSETEAIRRSSQLLQEHVRAQIQIQESAHQEILRLIEQEASARQVALSRKRLDEEERRRQALQIEQDVLAAKRQALEAAAADYRRHIDTLNAEAQRHLSEVQRIEEQKRLLTLSTEERIREIRRAGMADHEALEDRKRQITELQTQAREAIARGELDHARNLAQKAMDLSAQVATQQTSEAQRLQAERTRLEQDFSRITALEQEARAAKQRGDFDRERELLQQAAKLREETTQRAKELDRQTVSSKKEVEGAIDQIRASENLLLQALETEGRAHQRAADDAVSARDTVNHSLQSTQREIDAITDRLKAGITLTLEADTQELNRALEEVERGIADRDWLLMIEADLRGAQSQLEAYQAILAAGGTLPVDADVTAAQAALDRLKRYAEDAARADLKLSTEQAQAAIRGVEQSIRALNRLNTQSRHQVDSNVPAVRSEILALNNLNTSSTHTVYVRKVEQNATGGLVGVAAYAAGGAVTGFPWLTSGKVPGQGDDDTVPRTLPEGSFVLRKAAAEKYGSVLPDLNTKPSGSAHHGGVAALLTPGEFVVSPQAVARWGVDWLQALNQLRVPVARLPGFATGGLVSSSSIPLPTNSAENCATRTVRVELASGQQTVSTFAAIKDEILLLEMLEQARRRANAAR